MAHCVTVHHPTAVYSRSKARNFFKQMLRRSKSSSYFPRTILQPSPYAIPDFKPPCLCLNSSRASSCHTRFSYLRDYSCSKMRVAAGNYYTTTADSLKDEAKMVVCLKDGSLFVNGKVLLKCVPSNVDVYLMNDGLSSSFAVPSAAFLGAKSSVPSSRHVFTLGVLQECKFICLFRHKIWWMIPRFGSLASEIPMETQMLLLEVSEKSVVCDNDDPLRQPTGNTFYVLLLPVLEGQFRATLQGNSANELEFCMESGDPNVETTKVTESVFVNAGDNPFELIRESFKILERHKGTFAHIEHKKIPAHLDWFGWCTWDAFYKDVNPRAIKEGLESFLAGGCPPKFLIIDDGWQDTINEFQMDGEPFIDGSQFASRLVDLKESFKFMASGEDISCLDLGNFVKFIKENYSLKYVYVWHALAGYWGGVLPSSEKMKKYDPKICYPIQSPGNVGNLRDVAMDSLERYGVGLIDPKKIFNFYNDLHGYLSSCGVDGIKVDVQNLIETLGTGHGGRVSLIRKYQGALEESMARNFRENNLICCMSHNNDCIYSSRRSATARASEDFMPWEPRSQTLHVASVAFNSLLLGEIFVPDWDMFQTHHRTAEFHAVARAVGGCAVYVSDRPGMHDFNIIKKLVLPDGSVLRAQHVGRPTCDCLFRDVVMDGKSLLKIWNLNKLSGIVGVFNCQGAGNWPLNKVEVDEHCSSSNSKSLVLSSHIMPLDVEFLEQVVHESWMGDCAVYSFNKGSLSRVSKHQSIGVSLCTLECEIFTISPIRGVSESLQFAPIGLIDMYNSGGATEGFSSCSDSSGCSVSIAARGCGRFGAYSSKKPISCSVDGEEQEYEYDPDNNLLIVKLKGDCKIRKIDISY